MYVCKHDFTLCCTYTATQTWLIRNESRSLVPIRYERTLKRKRDSDTDSLSLITQHGVLIIFQCTPARGSWCYGLRPPIIQRRLHTVFRFVVRIEHGQFTNNPLSVKRCQTLASSGLLTHKHVYVYSDHFRFRLRFRRFIIIVLYNNKLYQLVLRVN